MAIVRVESYRDNETNKFVSKKVGRAAFKSAMNPSAIQTTQGFTESNEQTGMLLGVLSGMKSSLDELVSLTKESLGIDKREENREALDLRNKKIASGDTDVSTKKGFQFGGFLDTLKNVFGSVKEKFRFGDKLKLLLLATGLLALSKYSETIIDILAPALKYFKEKLIPKLRSFANYFLKYEEDTTEYFEDEFGNIKQRTTRGDLIGIDMDKITKAFAIGLAGYLTLKFLPSILWTVGGVLLRIPGIGLAVGVIGLGAYLIWSAIKMAGQAVIDSADWTKETGATDNSTANAVGSFFGGEIEGGFMNAIKNAGKWAYYFGIAGFTIGLFGGPIGAVAGGVLGVAVGAIFGGILGLIGGGFIARTYEFIQNSIIKMIDFTKDAILEQEYIAQKKATAAAFLKDNPDATEEEIMAALGFTPDMRGYAAQKKLIFKDQAFGITAADTIKETLEKQKKIEETFSGAINFETKKIDLSPFTDPDEISGKIVDIDRRLKQNTMTKNMLLENPKENSEELGQLFIAEQQLKEQKKQLQQKLQGYYRSQMQQSSRFTVDDDPTAPGNIGTGPLEITVPLPANAMPQISSLKEISERNNLLAELSKGINQSKYFDEKSPVVQYNKGGDVVSETANNNFAFNKASRHDDITMNELADSRLAT